ncbi:MAG: small, acid-soluble spore protein [Haloplasmataceae bacterium]|jgi:small acid-soluble spore protein I (minor)|nr:small, acid-soluble spore protein [Haloplasmataceae bacterium]
MNIDIRRAVLQNMNQSSFEDVQSTIQDAISTAEEKTLPGLGVLFEVLYNSSDNTGKQEIVNKLVKSLQ